MNAVRLDSGDLANLSKRVRQILNDYGLEYVKIFASGDLDEFAIEHLIKKQARIDAFGVGTRMSTSYDRPCVDVVYKLSGKVEKGEFKPAMKLSKNKITLPGKKQIFRQSDGKKKYAGDIVGLENEKVNGEPLLLKVMVNGKMIYDAPNLEEIRETASKNISQLPEQYKKLTHTPRYSVKLSPALRKIKSRLTRQLIMTERSARHQT